MGSGTVLGKPLRQLYASSGSGSGNLPLHSVEMVCFVIKKVKFCGGILDPHSKDQEKGNVWAGFKVTYVLSSMK